MTTTTLSPTPIFKGWDNNGLPLAYGKLYTYKAGTTTKLASYTDSTGSTPNANPMILNARGEAQVWFPPNVAYKQVLAPSTDTDPPTSPIWTVDNITNSQLISLYGGVDTGSSNNYVLNFNASFTAYQDGVIIYWIPSNSNSGVSAINVNSLGNVVITNPDGSSLVTGQIAANVPAVILYKSGSFQLITPANVTRGNFTVTLTGVTATVTGTAYWVKTGRIVVLTLPTLTGTSNATYKAYTGLPNTPVDITPAHNVNCVGAGLNNSASALTPILASIGPGHTQIDFYLLTSDGLWTSSGTCEVLGITMYYEAEQG